jgi:carbamoyltransferase
MTIMGISMGFHDAAVSVIDQGNILFAAHTERYSRTKNDPWLNSDIIAEALEHGTPDVIVLHERAWLKRLRNIMSGDWNAVREPTAKWWIKNFYPELSGIPIKQVGHHYSHVAAGVMTSGMAEACVVNIDAIGEFDSATIWHWKSGKLKKLHSVKFPNSLGLFYSAVTHRVGLKPMEDEYILMGMAAYGDPDLARQVSDTMDSDYFKKKSWISGKLALNMKANLHKGLDAESFPGVDDMVIARAAQMQAEQRIFRYCEYAKRITGSNNLVYGGGVALNCLANTQLFKLFDDIWIMPNPGDAGSSLGAAALYYYKKTGNMLNWQGPYTGTEIPGAYPIKKALTSLKQNKIFGIANGRAEFGPRALGNRSLMADPRGGDIQDRLNEIKKRQKFRPFAPIILEEFASTYFEMPTKQIPYMQFVVECKYPDKFPAVVHHDGTSRVQTVNRDQHAGLYKLLREFYDFSGCPMLVNTSLNIKGQPMVNTVSDAQDFAKHYGVEVHTSDV